MTIRRFVLTCLFVLAGLVAAPPAAHAIVRHHVSDTGVGPEFVPTGPPGCSPLHGGPPRW